MLRLNKNKKNKKFKDVVFPISRIRCVTLDIISYLKTVKKQIDFMKIIISFFFFLLKCNVHAMSPHAVTRIFLYYLFYLDKRSSFSFFSSHLYILKLSSIFIELYRINLFIDLFII